MATSRKISSFFIFLALIVLSASSAGFLVGRTVRLQEEGKFEQMRQVGEQVVDSHALIMRGVEAARRAVVR